MLTREAALDLFARRRDAWLASDLDAYLALFAPDLVFQSPAHAEPLRGREVFAALVRSSAAALQPELFEFTQLHRCDQDRHDRPRGGDEDTLAPRRERARFPAAPLQEARLRTSRRESLDLRLSFRASCAMGTSYTYDNAWTEERKRLDGIEAQYDAETIGVLGRIGIASGLPARRDRRRAHRHHPPLAGVRSG